MPDDRTFTAPPAAEAAPDPTRTAAPADPAVTLDPADPHGGRVAEADGGGRYVLGDEIARGGMGVVVRATDVVLNREVAVKILQERYGPGSAAAERFADEARISAQLQHPGIPPVHDLGALADGRPFLAMKLIRGDTLDDRLKRRADPGDDRGRFLAAFEQACQAVGFAHARGVIHRDLKPANVMVGAFGEVQVMDWGLAKVLTGPAAAADPGETTDADSVRSFRDSDGSFTQAGAILGTPAFMPPEQAIGATNKIDARSDVFGLGAVLAVILTGQPPFAAASAETTRLQAAQGKLDDCFARLDGCGADPEWVALCKRCLAPDPAARPADGGAVAAAVADLRHAADDRARRAELDRVKAEGEAAAAEVRAAEQRKRRQTQAALGLAFTALVAVAGGFAWWADRHEVERDAERQRTAAEQRQADDRRRADAEAGVDRSFADAQARYGRARGAGRDMGLWAEAEGAAAQTARVADAAGVTGERRGRVDRHREEVNRYVRNLRLVATLVEIQQALGDTCLFNGMQDFPTADTRYAAAFREYGVDLLTSSAETAVDRLREAGEEFRAELAAAIDDWGYVRFAVSGRMDDTGKLFRVTRALDPDPLRNRIRAVVAARDVPGLTRLSEELDPAREPTQTVNLVGVYLHWFGDRPNAAARRFLVRAQPYHPGNFQLNHNTAHILNSFGVGGEALGYALAALAARPQSAVAWDDRAYALQISGRHDEAAVAYRHLLRLAPDNALGWARLQVTLSAIGLADDARAAGAEVIRVYEALIRKYPNAPHLYTTLASQHLLNGDRPRALQAYRVAVGKNPTDAAAQYVLSTLLRADGDVPGADAALAQARRLDPARYGPAPAFFSGRLHGHLGAAYGVAFTPDGRLTSSSLDGTIRTWDIGGRRELSVARAPSPQGLRTHAVRPDPAAPDRSQLLGGTFDGKVVMFTPAPLHTGRIAWAAVPLSGQHHRNEVLGLAVSPDGRFALSASNEPGQGLRVWNLETRALERVIPATGCISVSVRPDGREATTMTVDRKMLVWSLGAWTARRPPDLDLDTYDGVAYSQDGRLLATAQGPGGIRLRDADTLAKIRDFSGHDGLVIGLAFAPGARVLASGSHDKTVRLWDVETGELLHTFDGHASFVRHVAFSPDGRTVASASWDRTVGLWDIPAHVRPLIPTTRPTAPAPRPRP